MRHGARRIGPSSTQQIRAPCGQTHLEGLLLHQAFRSYTDRSTSGSWVGIILLMLAKVHYLCYNE